MVGEVRRAEGDVEEEGLLGVTVAVVVHEGDRVVDDVGGEVVVGGVRDVDPVVVLDQVGLPLVGQAVRGAVVAVEPALQRPLVEGPGAGELVHRGEVPLADPEGRVALRLRHLGDRRRRLVQHPGVAGVAHREVGQHAHAGRVVVAPGEQAGARRRAQRRHVEVGVAQSLGREAVGGRGRDVGPEAAEVGPAEVVVEDVDDVRGALPGPLGRREVRRGVGEGPTDRGVAPGRRRGGIVVGVRHGRDRRNCQGRCQ